MNIPGRLSRCFRSLPVVLPAAAGWVVAVCGGLVMLWWMLDIATLKSVLPGLVTMKFNTAAGFLGLGLALGLLSDRRCRGWRKAVALPCAGLAGVVGLLTIAEYSTGWNAGIDQLFWKDIPTLDATDHPGRMAMNTALCLSLAAVALLFRGAARAGLVRTAAVEGGLGVMVATFAVCAFLGYTTDDGASSSPWSYIGMEAFPAFLLLLLGAGLFRLAWSEISVAWQISLPATASFGAGLGCLLALGWLTFRSAALMVSASALETRAIEALNHLHLLQTGLVDMQNGVRGYALTGDVAFRKPYDEGLKSVPNSLREVERVVASPFVKEGLAALEPIVAEWLAFSGAEIAESESGKLDATIAAIRAGRGERLSREMRRRITEMEVEEMRLLALRETRAHAGVRQTFFVLPLGGAFTLLAGVIAIFLLNREMAGRATSEQNLLSRTSQLENANDELEAFSYSVSHDLRAPLRAIDGYSRILVEDYNELLQEEGCRVLGVVRSESQRMGQLIDELLNFSRVGRQHMEPRETDMRALAEVALKEAKALQPNCHVQVQFTPLPVVQGEPLMLRQVWANLLANAVKFTRHRPDPRIEIGATHRNGEQIYFVRDNGAGFDMAHYGKLFGVFQRLHGEAEFEGTGVGLAFVKRIVQRHGGRVWAEGAIDRGATFFFALPAEIRAGESPLGPLVEGAIS